MAIGHQYSSLGTQPNLCGSIPGLLPKQLRFCRNYVEIMPSVAEGVKIGIQECQHQFRGRRWNCTTVNDSLAIFGPVLDKGEWELWVWGDECPWWSGSRDPEKPPASSFPSGKISCKMFCKRQELSWMQEWGYLSSSWEQGVGLESSPNPFQHELSHDPTPLGRNTGLLCLQ